MSIVVYWMDVFEAGGLMPRLVRESNYQLFKDSELTQALKHAELKRKEGKTHVVISSEMSDCVGKGGVSAVEHGKTPDGHDYEWSKQHRGGPPLPSE